MIADLDATIRQLIVDELPIANGEIDVAFQQPRREWSARLSRPAINCFLYDVRENAQLRTHQWETVANGRARNGAADPNQAVRKRSPLRIDCSYLVTAWAFDPGDEHRLLTSCLLALARYPVLPTPRLNESLRASSHEVRTRLASHDLLPNGADLWSALDNELRPGLTYVVTLALDPWTAVAGPTVRTLSLATKEHGHGRPNSSPQAAGDGGEPARTTIGGTVRNRAAGDAPLAGVEVALKGTGLYTRTDAAGRFRFTGVIPGTYHLVVAGPEAEAPPREITVPAPAGADYDLSILPAVISIPDDNT
jgi:hypothetical protein